MRRNVLLAILDQWVKVNITQCHPEKDSLFSIQECGDEATVGDLLEALSIPGFMDVKLRVEKLMKINVR